MEAWKANEAAAGTPAKETPADAKRNAQKEGAAKGYHGGAACSVRPPDGSTVREGDMTVHYSTPPEWCCMAAGVVGQAAQTLVCALSMWGTRTCPGDGFYYEAAEAAAHALRDAAEHVCWMVEGMSVDGRARLPVKGRNLVVPHGGAL